MVGPEAGEYCASRRGVSWLIAKPPPEEIAESARYSNLLDDLERLLEARQRMAT